MSEYRRDPIVNRWVIMAPLRAARPNEFPSNPLPQASHQCPFCAGNESLTPHEIAAVRAGGTPAEEPGWRVRVIPNKYPAVIGASSHDSASTPQPSSMIIGDCRSKCKAPASGIHEIIIESPRHVLSVSDLEDDELADALAMFRERLLAARAEPHVRFGLIFKNVGPGAGASIVHTHSQLIGLPKVPQVVAEELAAAHAFHLEQGRCIFCDLVAKELSDGARIVFDSEEFLAFCPYASRFPFETWLLPKRHESHFEHSSLRNIGSLALALRRCIEKIERTVQRSDYNFLIHSTPFDIARNSHYHWHIEIFPRTTTTAGFEWATGEFINPVFPEVAAKMLRQQ